MHGYEKKEVLDKHIALLCHTEDQLINEARPFIEKVKEKGSYSDEINHVRKNGSTFLSKLSASLLKNDNGKEIGIILIASDITKRKQASFKKANNMLRKNIECLDEFILHNPKGKKLMQYYLKLEEGLSFEQNQIMGHINRLTDKVDAIVEVISAQQGYAGVSAFSEEYGRKVRAKAGVQRLFCVSRI